MALERLSTAILAARRTQAQLFHLLLHCRHGTQMLHVQLLSRILELIDSTLHLLKIRIDLSSVLVVNIDDLNQAFL